MFFRGVFLKKALERTVIPAWKNLSRILKMGDPETGFFPGSWTPA